MSADASQTPRPKSAARPRRGIVTTLIVLATLIGILAGFAVWSARQLLETEQWTETSSQLLADERITDAVAGFLVDELFANVDVQGELESALPPRLAPLAGPAAGGLRQLADNQAPKLLQRPRVQGVWEQANRVAHEQFLAIVNDEAPAIAADGEVVNLDLGVVAKQLGTGLGIDLAGKIPEGFAQVEILKADQLETVQNGAALLEDAAYVLTALFLLLLALAVYLARGWRRVALRSCGFAFVAVGLVIVVARGVAGNLVVASLAPTEAVEPAAEATWEIGTSLLGELGVAVIGYGLVIILAAWLASPGTVATAARGSIAPFLRDRLVLYPILLAIVLLVIWWSPTEGTRRLLPSLILVALLIGGAEALRRQTIREFPERTLDDLGERLRTGAAAGWSRARGAIPRRASAQAPAPEAPSPGAPAPAPGESDRIAQLERLAALHRDGILDDEELAREKHRLLAG